MASRPSLDAPLDKLSGVGPKLSESLARLGLYRITDLLFHLPLRYQDRTRVSPIGSVGFGDEVLIEGRIEAAQVVFGRRRSLVCRIADGSGAMHLRFFHFNRSQQQRLQQGRQVRCFGEARRGPQTLEMIHPECQLVNPDEPTAVAEELTPIYPTTEGLQQNRLRKLSDQSLVILEQDSALGNNDWLAAELPDDQSLPDLVSAVRYVHRPPPDADIGALREYQHPAQRRLIIEELIAHQISLRELRNKARAFAAPKLKPGNLRQQLLQQFGFTLTAAQQRVISEIDDDLMAAIPMLRLLQGDVGAGKTAVAAAVAAACLESGYSIALMAPTELLAEQHRRNLTSWFEPLGIDVVFLSGRLKRSEKNVAIERLNKPGAVLAIGTHALFQDEVHYHKLGLIIVDEQHRFGVDQRLALRNKGADGEKRPHQLIMTATPIPRTLAMTAYADLDVSVLDELPPGRKSVNTLVIPQTRRDEVVARIHQAIKNGRQVYWVCPLIDESELLDSQAATETAEALREALDDVRVDLIHGRLSEREKDRAMAAFAAAETDLLVATTVVEVGVDVPNASLMVIENAERLGLSQLHQLRGRVGRGEAQSDCLLLYKTPLSQMARERLKVMRESNDGFVIAERDLQLRGPGEMLGTRQAGSAQFRIADLSRDAALLPQVQKIAQRLSEQQPEIASALVERWLKHRLGYAVA